MKALVPILVLTTGVLGFSLWISHGRTLPTASSNTYPKANSPPFASPKPPPPSRAMNLPSPEQLLNRCRALAALDLILSPEWQYRYYSFNSRWDTGEKMASMRNGSGDEWWIVFSDAGWTALKGLAHESPSAGEQAEGLSKALQAACPVDLREFAHEPAFRWDHTGFCFFHPEDAKGWQRANDLTPFGHLESREEELFEHVTGSAEDYVRFAADYYEMELPLDVVRQVFELKPISPEMFASLNPETDHDEISDELYEEIGYPR